MSRVLLVNPPFYRLLGSHYNANSLGIAYISSFLNKNGHDCWLYNADFLGHNEFTKYDVIHREKGFKTYKDYFSNTDGYIWEEVVEKIIKFEPEWVGYTSYTANIQTIDILSTKVRERKPKIKQIIGGVHATLDHNLLDKLKNIDYSVQREGEEAMLALVNGNDPRTISGVACREGTKIIGIGDANVIKSIDDLPLPERNKFYGMSEEEKQFIDVSYICSIRGCPYRCNYCASPFHWKRDKTQYRSPESVLDEMKHLKSNYWNKKKYDYSASGNVEDKSKMIIEDNTIVYFVDDIFTVKKPRVKQIMRNMIDNKLDMPWKCEARTDHLDEEIAGLMKQTNCNRVKLGFESGSDRILKEIQKDETTEDMKVGAKLLRDAGVPFTAYFMAGFPGETDDDVRQTIELAKEIQADYYVLSILSPYYGTKLYFDLMDMGYELDKQPWEFFYHHSGEMMVNNQISNEMLTEYLRLNELNNTKENYV
tara:strand:+ start:390 stop:1829 length:1440 start_codon:yes stop_codon:yes gene_type:complete